jgi:glycosyltransferase involved in cell wall biosynthesis
MGSLNEKPPFADRFEDITLGKLFVKLNDLSLVSCSYRGKEDYVKKGFPPSALYAIPNGIDYKKFTKGTKTNIIKEFNLKNKIVLGIVGRLTETKNHHTLIRMFKKLTLKYDNAILLIVGGGPAMAHLKQITVDLNLTEKVIFTGNRKDIPDLLATMDIFVFPSLTEDWPNAVGEAMAAGLPVVSFDVGDVKKVIKNNYDGFVVGKDINKLMKVTMKLIETPALRRYIGNNAKINIKNNFSLESMVIQYEQFYIKLKNKSKN